MPYPRRCFSVATQDLRPVVELGTIDWSPTTDSVMRVTAGLLLSALLFTIYSVFFPSFGHTTILPMAITSVVRCRFALPEQIV